MKHSGPQQPHHLANITRARDIREKSNRWDKEKVVHSPEMGIRVCGGFTYQTVCVPGCKCSTFFVNRYDNAHLEKKYRVLVGVSSMPTLGGNLDDVWASPFEDRAAPTEAVVARAAVVAPAGTEAPVEPTEPAINATLLRELLDEMRIARLESARHHRINLAVGCLCVAILLAYMDRLRSQIRLKEMHVARENIF